MCVEKNGFFVEKKYPCFFCEIHKKTKKSRRKVLPKKIVIFFWKIHKKIHMNGFKFL